jgi:hypothetical protein
MLSRLTILVVAVSSLSLPSAAQWTLGGYIGQAHTQNSGLAIRQPALATDIRFSNIAYSSESFQPPLYYGVRAGYQLRPHWGIEAELTHLKVFANIDRATVVTGTLNGASINGAAPINSIVQRFSISHGVNLLLANAVFRHQLGRSATESSAPVYLVFRAGAGATIPHAESTIEGQTDEHYQVGSPAFQLAGGIEARIGRRLYWSGEYKFTQTRQHVAVHAGTAATLLQSHHLITGPVIHF